MQAVTVMLALPPCSKMKDEILVLGLLVVAGVVAYAFIKQQPRNYVGYAPITGTTAQGALNAAGVSAVTQVGGALIKNLVDALNPNSSGVHGVTETNATTPYTETGPFYMY